MVVPTVWVPGRVHRKPARQRNRMYQRVVSRTDGKLRKQRTVFIILKEAHLKVKADMESAGVENI